MEWKKFVTVAFVALLVIMPVVGAATTNINSTRVLTTDLMADGRAAIGRATLDQDVTLLVNGAARVNGSASVNGTISLLAAGVNRGVLTHAVLTASRTWTFQDVGGTVPILEAVAQTWSGNATWESAVPVTDEALVGSPNVTLRAKYDAQVGTPVVATNRDAILYHNITAGGASPTSRVGVTIGGVEVVTVKLDGSPRFGVNVTDPEETIQAAGSLYLSPATADATIFVKHQNTSKEKFASIASPGSDMHFGSGWSGSGTNGNVYVGFGMDATSRAILLGYGGGLTTVRTATSTFLATDAGNVAVGNSSATAKLHVQGATPSLSGTSGGMLLLDSTDALAIDKGGVVSFGGVTNGAGTHQVWAKMAGLKETGTSGDTAGYLSFHTDSGAAWGERLRITSAGTVRPGSNGGQALGTSSFHWGRGYFANDVIIASTSAGLAIQDSAGAWWRCRPAPVTGTWSCASIGGEP